MCFLWESLQSLLLLVCFFQIYTHSVGSCLRQTKQSNTLNGLLLAATMKVINLVHIWKRSYWGEGDKGQETRAGGETMKSGAQSLFFTVCSQSIVEQLR